MTKKRKRNRQLVSSFLFLVLLVAAGVVAYFVWDGYFRDKGTEPSEPEETLVEQPKEKPKETEIEKEDEDKEEKDDEAEVDEKEKPSYDGDDVNLRADLTGVVTYAGVSGEQLMIRVNIDQYLGEGECRLNLKRDGEILYSDAASIVGSAATATCEGFNVPLSSIGGGYYKVEVLLDSGDRSGTIMGEVEI